MMPSMQVSEKEALQIENDELYQRIEQLQAQVAEYNGDREFFQQRDMEQCREISRNHIKIEQLEAQVDADEIAFTEVAKSFDADRMRIEQLQEQIMKLSCEGEWCGKSPRKKDHGLCGVCKLQAEINGDGDE